MKKTSAFVVTALAIILAAAGARGEIVVIDEGSEDGGNPGTRISVPRPTEGSGVKADEAKKDVLDFLNQDKLHGTLVSIAPSDYGLRWKLDGSTKDIDLSLGGLSTIALARRNVEKRTAPSATVRLTNDDILDGVLVSMDETQVILDTWYAGRVEIKRSMVKSLHPNATSSTVVYEGPNELSEWTIAQGGGRAAWKYKNGALLAMNQQYPIGKILDRIPESADIQFEIAWKRYPALYFAFYTDNIQQYYGNCYLLLFSGGSVHLQRCSRDGNTRNLGQLQVETFGRAVPGRARVNLLVDKKKAGITLMLNGQMVKQWTDASGFGGMGNGILFLSQDTGGMKISSIRISEWDGQIPGQPSAGGEAKEDLIRFVNGDKVSGKLKGIAQEKITFETSYAPMEIPLKRAVDIELSSGKAERARRNKDDIRALFTEKGSITMQITSLEKNILGGSSENFGAMTLPLGALRKIEFNIYKEKEVADDDDF